MNETDKFPVHTQWIGKIVGVHAPGEHADMGDVRPALIYSITTGVKGVEDTQFCHLVVFSENGLQYRHAQQEARGDFHELDIPKEPQAEPTPTTLQNPLRSWTAENN